MRRLLALLLALFMYSLVTPVAGLASESALSVAPAILESILDSKVPTKLEVSLQNNTNFPLPIKGSVNAFLSSEAILDSINPETFNASAWFQLEPADFILQPNEVKKIRITITPPANSEPGGHYATIFFQPLIPQEAISQSTTISLARVGILTFLVIPGDIKESLLHKKLTGNPWQSFGPVTFTNELENNGAVHLLPLSTLTIKNIFRQAVVELKASPSIILPGTLKSQTFTWDTYLGFGRYTAQVTTSYGTDHPSLTSPEVSFWLIPWPLILLLCGGLTFIYKIFIVNHERLFLAFKVLKGTYDPTQINQKNSPRRPNRTDGTHPALPRLRRRARRQSNRQ